MDEVDILRSVCVLGRNLIRPCGSGSSDTVCQISSNKKALLSDK